MSEYILEIQNLTKDFPGVRALDSVNLKVKKGEIHSLCGENGAGKSTLMSVISGVYPKGSYEGKVIYKGKETHYTSVKDSEKEFLAIIHQELALSPYLSIYENIFLGHMKTRLGIINWDKYISESKVYLDQVGLKENPGTIVSKLGVGKQQLVEIARALSKQVELLILDEPTSSLNDEESDKLLNFILELKKRGITSIMISHKLKEVLKIADSVTILRDGKSISAYDVKKDSLNEAMIIRDMVGRDLQTHPDKHAIPLGDTVFEVKNWTVYHPDYHSLKVVDNASFYLRKGEILAFVGPSGGGKSTLVDLIPRFYDPSQGAIFFDNKDIKDIRIEDLRRQMGIVTQETFLFNESIKKNIAYGLTEFPFEKVVEAAKTANAHNFIMEMPQGYETVIGERGVKISGGQRQRLSIARALLKNPEIMIFDEATSALDNESELLVQEAIERLMINRTTFVIAHRLSTIRNATNIIVLDRGKVVQYGTHDELIENEKGLYRKFYEMQFRD